MTHPAFWRMSARDELLTMTERLTAEYAGRVPADTVIRCVYRSREELMHAGVRTNLVPAAEQSARMQLRHLVGAHVAS